MKVHQLALISALALAAPAATAEAQWGRSGGIMAQGDSQAVREGRDRGVRAGEDDGRRNESFNYADESDYRRGDLGYRSQYGNRERYRDVFRRAFADGYREGYERMNRRYDDRNLPPWSNGRGRGAVPRGGIFGGGVGNRQVDIAFANGYREGYDAGLDDGRDNRRAAPTSESRYRDDDRGYKREYGDREAYRLRYRDGFIEGYRDGYADGNYRIR